MIYSRVELLKSCNSLFSELYEHEETDANGTIYGGATTTLMDHIMKQAYASDFNRLDPRMCLVLHAYRELCDYGYFVYGREEGLEKQND